MHACTQCLPISTQESYQADNGPVIISKSIYNLNSRAKVFTDEVFLYRFDVLQHMQRTIMLYNRIQLLITREKRNSIQLMQAETMTFQSSCN